jgi:hypothetical protein
MSDPSGFGPLFEDEQLQRDYYDYTHSIREANAVQQTATLIDTKSPPPPEAGYLPPKNPDKGKRRVTAPGARGETGWLDKKGNVWVPDVDMDGGEGWRRHYPDGSHDHVYPNGKVRSHDSVINPFFMNGVEIIVIPIIITYEIIKTTNIGPALSY